MKNKVLKSFNIQDALSGKAVMLRDGTKAFVRHHETELPIDENVCLTGFTAKGSLLTWCENGNYFATSSNTNYDIIGMYPKTKLVNGFEVPAPETKELEYHTGYYLASTITEHFYRDEVWNDHHNDKLWLERGLVFLNKEDAIATAKAMMGIDPNSETEQ